MNIGDSWGNYNWLDDQKMDDDKPWTDLPKELTLENKKLKEELASALQKIAQQKAIIGQLKQELVMRPER